ncbi:MAG: hypothetical protein DWQ36_02350 [Acidobacteria bacterium]|nr:MAG: hypothetical protein DWQ30_23740 [Acidobacteriota bacterium]REK11284.1 MAG: hypothetical protein DWQ36_02350 [Acidobacteriota bacterium]
MRQRLFLALLLCGALITVGCSTTAGGGDVTSPAAEQAMAEPDYTDEVGENGLLTPRAVIARFIEALGGEETIRSHTSMQLKGKMEMPAMGMSGETTIVQAAPDKMIMNIEMAGFGTMNNGVLGDVAWADSPMTGAMLLDGEMKRQALQQADFYASLNYEDTYPTMETVELTEYNGEEAYKLRLVDDAGKESTQWFSAETGLMIGVKATQVNEMGESEVTQTITEYKEFGGVMVPTQTTMNMMGMEIKQSVSEVTWDSVTEDQLQPPDSIKALLDK